MDLFTRMQQQLRGHSHGRSVPLPHCSLHQQRQRACHLPTRAAGAISSIDRLAQLWPDAPAGPGSGPFQHNGQAMPAGVKGQQSNPAAATASPPAFSLERLLPSRSSSTCPEVVWGPGKSADQIAAALQALTEKQRTAIAARIEPDVYAAVRKHVPGVEYNARARTLLLRSPCADELPRTERLAGSVAIVSSGTSDQSVAEEAKVLAEYLGCYCFRVADVSVSDLYKLLSNLDALRAADVLVVVCGTDAALPAAVAGLVDSPVIAVPTSSGFGASLGGLASLLASLTSMAPGVSVVNIDYGLGAAQAAARILRMATRLHKVRSAAQAAAAALTAASEAVASAVTVAHSSANGAGTIDSADGSLHVVDSSGNGVHVADSRTEGAFAHKAVYL